MTKTFKLQDPGEGIHEAEILDVKVTPGDRVEEGDILLEVETDKAAVEIPSPFTGTVDEVTVSVGDRARVGQALITYSDAEAAEAADEDVSSKEEGEGRESKDRTGSERTESRPEETDASKEQGGSGDGVAKDSTKTASTKDRAQKARAADPVQGASAGKDKTKTPVPASPATRRLARELDVNIRSVSPSGPNGRVTADDVRAHAGGGGGEGSARKGEDTNHEKTTAEPAADFGAWGSVRREPLRGIRRATAHKMITSWTHVPHVTHADVADITELEEFRQEYKAAVEKEGGKLTITVLVLKAAVAALKSFPRFNASIDSSSEEIVYKEYFHIGVAVATDRGLLVPVVRDVETKSVVELGVELKELADRARAHDLDRNEMSGGSFTVTNPGGIGGTGFTPIINHPEVAILGLGAARLEPVIQGSRENFAVVPRFRLPVSLTFDHRLNDGADAAKFVRKVVEILENPEFLALHA